MLVDAKRGGRERRRAGTRREVERPAGKRAGDPGRVVADRAGSRAPAGFSPRNAARPSSGTSVVGDAVDVGSSVTSPSFRRTGTWPPGSDRSSQSVPSKTSSSAPPLSVVSVTTVPDGEVRVTSRSAEFEEWAMAASRVSRQTREPMPARGRRSSKWPSRCRGSARASRFERSGARGRSAVRGRVASVSDQPPGPLWPAATSLTRSVQIPFGSSPTNAPRASSGRERRGRHAVW